MGEDKRSERCHQDQRGVEACRRIGPLPPTEHAASQREDCQEESQRVQGKRGSRSGIRYAKQPKGGRHAPVQQGSLLQVANAVRVESHVVVAPQHLAGNFGMHGIRAIQERRIEQRKTAVQQQPEAHQHEYETLDWPGIATNAG